MKKNMNKTTKNNFITYGMVIAIFVVVQILSSTGNLSRLLTGLLVPICVYIIASLSLNLVVGYSGELSLGHAGFMCVGAFTGAFFSRCMENVITVAPVRLTLAILIGAVCAGLIGLLIGMPVLRLKGDYLAIVTLAFGEIIKNVINVIYVGKDANGIHISMKDAASMSMESNGDLIINGAQGITGTPKDSNFIVGTILILITLFIVLNLIKSRDGRAIMSIRDNRIAAESIGINVTYFKLAVFMLSAFFAGAAGTLYGHFFANVKAASFDYNMSIEILVIVVLGGMGSVPGSIIAAIVLQLLPELMREFADYRMLLYAIVLILVMLATNDPRMREFFERLRPSNLVRKLAAKNKKEAQTDD